MSGERTLSRPADLATNRTLIIPAAGLGSRLGLNLPKVLVPVDGRPMIDWLVELYAPYVTRIVVVVSPALRTAVSEHLAELATPATVVEQETPTGMLDAILLARPIVEAGSSTRVWITWCDQIGIHPETVARLAAVSDQQPSAAIVMPTCVRTDPYIHLQRDAHGRIEQVLHKREGDVMPAVGEGDMGLFSLSRAAFVDDLLAFSDAVEIGGGTGERNFLPFIPRAEHLGGVVTYPCIDAEESIGVNTPQELEMIERYLRQRSRR